MDRLSEYVIKHSLCCMPRCEYVENDIDIDCDRCKDRMIQEHDEQIRADAIDEMVLKLETNMQNKLDEKERYGYTVALSILLEQLKEK